MINYLIRSKNYSKNINNKILNYKNYKMIYNMLYNNNNMPKTEEFKVNNKQSYKEIPYQHYKII